MATFTTATTAIDNYTFTGTTNNTLFLQKQANLQAGDYFDGGAGTDKIQIRSSMAGETVFDLRGMTLRSFEQLSYYPMGGMDMVGTVTFSSSQFGTDAQGNALISNSLRVIASNYSVTDVQKINVYLTTGASNFDAHAWTFTGWNTAPGASQDLITLYGSTGANRITGSIMADTLSGGGGADTMAGGLGSDVYITDGADTITEAANAGTDRVQSTVSYVLGSNLEDLTLTGSRVINGTGNTLANKITGNTRVNILDGGAGADTLTGGAGADKLTGGTGSDKFVFLAATDSTVAASDQIVDFTAGDKIDVSAIDANAGVTSDQAFLLDALGVTTFAAGHIRQSVSGADIVLEFNTDADATAEFRIVVLNHGALSGSDFML